MSSTPQVAGNESVARNFGQQTRDLVQQGYYLHHTFSFRCHSRQPLMVGLAVLFAPISSLFLSVASARRAADYQVRADGAKFQAGQTEDGIDRKIYKWSRVVLKEVAADKTETALAQFLIGSGLSLLALALIVAAATDGQIPQIGSLLRYGIAITTIGIASYALVQAHYHLVKKAKIAEADRNLGILLSPQPPKSVSTVAVAPAPSKSVDTPPATVTVQDPPPPSAEAQPAPTATAEPIATAEPFEMVDSGSKPGSKTSSPVLTAARLPSQPVSSHPLSATGPSGSAIVKPASGPTKPPSPPLPSAGPGGKPPSPTTTARVFGEVIIAEHFTPRNDAGGRPASDPAAVLSPRSANGDSASGGGGGAGVGGSRCAIC